MTDRGPSPRPQPTQDSGQPAGTEALLEALQQRRAYPEPVSDPVVMHETHISWIFLAGDHAYKVKKAVRTDFLDYSTLDRREHYCREELRLDRRYAEPLYLGVVPITASSGQVTVEGDGPPIEFAVKMRRFPADSLLTDRVRQGQVGVDDVRQLARTVARFHAAAAPSSESESYGSFDRVREDADANFRDLRAAGADRWDVPLDALQQWTERFLRSHRDALEQRRSDGFIRECHGDLHSANVVRWNDQWMPFDGIEFNADLRWIDVLNDAAFLAMDLAAEDHEDLSRSFITAYLEDTGDYGSLELLRFYMVYRAMVRAKVAMIRGQQAGAEGEKQSEAMEDCRRHIELADRFTAPPPQSLSITHGYSGSGKTTGSERWVQHHGAVRLRSDVERKRLHGMAPEQRPAENESAKLYSPSASRATYRRLAELAQHVLRAGYPVIVDAAFLQHRDRQAFAELAESQGVRFHLLDFPVDPAVLRQRVAQRQRRGGDASDAGPEVLEKQLRSAEPLNEAEREFAVEMPAE